MTIVFVAVLQLVWCLLVAWLVGRSDRRISHLEEMLKQAGK